MSEIAWPDGMDPKKQEALQEMLNLFDASVTQLNDSHHVVFASEEVRKSILYGSIAKWGKAWSKSGTCMHAGCTKKSIKRSHTISLGTSIDQIAENGHVLTPKFGENGIELVSVGHKLASTFPGFCDEHELIFEEFENQKSLTEGKHFQLQVLRTICREIYTKRHGQQKIGDMLNDYRRLRDNYMQRSMGEFLQGENALTDKVKFSFSEDSTEDEITILLKKGSEDLIELQALYDGIVGDLKTETSNIAITVMQADLQIPVCLSGLGVLNYKNEDVVKRALCCIAILPEEVETNILLATMDEHSKAASLYLSDDAFPAAIARLESWMVYGSDHWFIRPSSWEAMSDTRKTALCDAISELRSLSEEVPFSILDDARSRIITEIKRALKTSEIDQKYHQQARDLLVREQSKLEYTNI